MKKKRNTLVLLILLLVGISIGYAALTSTLNINGNTNIKKVSWDIHFENLVKTPNSETATKEATIDSSKTLIEYTVNLKEPGDFYEFTVDIVNKGSIDAMISEILKTGLTESEQKYIEYTTKYEDGIELKEKDSLKSGEKETIKVTVKYKEDILPSDLPEEDYSLNLKFQVTYIQDDGSSIERNNNKLFNKIIKNAKLDNTNSEYVSSTTGINFSNISSNTNGKGIYKLSNTTNDKYPIYYYRGAVDNNNVSFAGFCWKIVRTTETGGVKLLYNGTPSENGECNNQTAESSKIGTTAYNRSTYNNAFVGYMYGDPNSTTYEDTHKNVNDSTIKIEIDKWYESNMLNYTEQLEDAVWCNDRSISTGTGISNSNTYYQPYNRIVNLKTPSLECTNKNDRFTVNSKNGNGALTYPIALLTVDEVVLAGGININKDYYLYTGQYWALLSPAGFYGGNSIIYDIGQSGAIFYSYMTSASVDIRPSIVLKNNTLVSTGYGTSANPYIIENIK